MHKLAGTQEGQDIFSLASDFLPVGTLDTLHKTTGLPPSLWMATARPHTTQSVSRCIECQLGRWQDEDGENPKPTACKHVTSEFCHDTLFVPLSEFLGRVLEFVNITDFHMIAEIGPLRLVLPPKNSENTQKQNRWYWWHGGLRHGSWKPLARAPVTLARQIVEYELETAKTHEPLLQIRLGFVAPASEKTKNYLEETTAALRKDFVEYTHTHTFHADVAPLNLSSLGPQDYVQWDFCIALWDPLNQPSTNARGCRKFRKAHNNQSQLLSYLELTTFERQNHYSTENEFNWSKRHNV